MKRYILFILFATIAIGVSAQKASRKAIRQGNDAYNEQLFGKAQEKYQKALEDAAGSKEASFNLANTYYKQQLWDEAEKEYQHYLTLENEDPIKMSAAWANVGNLFLKKKNDERGMQQPQMQQEGQQQQADNLQKTMEAYKNALRLNPNDDDVRYNLAVVKKMLDDQNEGGGGQNDKQDDKKDEDKKEDKKDQDQKQDQNQNQDKKDDKQDKQKENGMSQENMEQVLKALEQEEKETQNRVSEAKAQERKRQNMHNQRHNKNW